jgi:hypothetical protein
LHGPAPAAAGFHPAAAAGDIEMSHEERWRGTLAIEMPGEERQRLRPTWLSSTSSSAADGSSHDSRDSAAVHINHHIHWPPPGTNYQEEPWRHWGIDAREVPPHEVEILRRVLTEQIESDEALVARGSADRDACRAVALAREASASEEARLQNYDLHMDRDFADGESHFWSPAEWLVWQTRRDGGQPPPRRAVQNNDTAMPHDRPASPTNLATTNWARHFAERPTRGRYRDPGYDPSDPHSESSSASVMSSRDGGEMGDSDTPQEDQYSQEEAGDSPANPAGDMVEEIEAATALFLETTA